VRASQGEYGPTAATPRTRHTGTAAGPAAPRASVVASAAAAGSQDCEVARGRVHHAPCAVTALASCNRSTVPSQRPIVAGSCAATDWIVIAGPGSANQ
jgi:hypothetical protein